VKFLLTLDYELFFGAKTGTPDGCLIYPTRVLTNELERHGFLVTLFVDAGYLDRLSRSPEKLHKFQLERISTQLQQLVIRGHDVQLHVHPHWEDTHWTNGKWEMNTTRYRLQSFSCHEISELLERYTALLGFITGIRPTAFRAGGWCLQPFESLAGPLSSAGIHIDSTVYARGKSVNPGREFDFSTAPDRDRWAFDADPLSPQDTGRFLEVPITACRVSPVFYWEALWKKLVKQAGDKPLGDGHALSNSKEYYVRKLFYAEDTVASIDGPRAQLLERSYQKTRERRHGIFNVMGHPKSLTRNSIHALGRFLSRHGALLEPSVLRDFAQISHGFKPDVLPSETVIAFNNQGQR
jgi:hypothetical protein